MASIAAFACDLKNHPQDFISDTLIRESATGNVCEKNDSCHHFLIKQFGLESTFRPRGRPRHEAHDDKNGS